MLPTVTDHKYCGSESGVLMGDIEITRITLCTMRYLQKVKIHPITTSEFFTQK